MQRSAHGLQAFASARVFMCMDWWHRVADFPMNRWNDSHNHSFPFSYLSVKVNRNESEQSHAFYESEDCLANVDNMCPTHQQPIFSCIHNNGKSKHLSASKQTKKLTVYKSIVEVRMITEREPKLKRYTYSKRFAQKAFWISSLESLPDMNIFVEINIFVGTTVISTLHACNVATQQRKLACTFQFDSLSLSIRPRWSLLCEVYIRDWILKKIDIYRSCWNFEKIFINIMIQGMFRPRRC